MFLRVWKEVGETPKEITDRYRKIYNKVAFAG